MNPGLTALAIGIVAAGIVAVATRDTRSAIVATLVVLVASPVLAGALPEPLPLGARFAAAILAAYLLWAAVRGQRSTAGSPLGWTAELLVAAAAGVAGWGLAVRLAATAGAPPESAAAGAALLAVAAGPVVSGREALRSSVGALLAVQGAWLLRVGLPGRVAAIDELALAVLVGTLGGVGAALVARARHGSGGLELGARRPVAVAEGRTPHAERRPDGPRHRRPRST